jgi:hypothetical protein
MIDRARRTPRSFGWQLAASCKEGFLAEDGTFPVLARKWVQIEDRNKCRIPIAKSPTYSDAKYSEKGTSRQENTARTSVQATRAIMLFPQAPRLLKLPSRH